MNLVQISLSVNTIGWMYILFWPVLLTVLGLFFKATRKGTYIFWVMVTGAVVFVGGFHLVVMTTQQGAYLLWGPNGDVGYHGAFWDKPTGGQ